MKEQGKPCFNVITAAEIDDFPHCCGISVLAEFNTAAGARHAGYDPLTYKALPLKDLATRKEAQDYLADGGEKLFLATTIPHQKDAIAALQAIGFKKITITPSNEGRYSITLWMWKRPRRKRNG